MRELYDRYVAAKLATGVYEEIKYDALVATVAKQTPQIMQKYGCKTVDFSVVLKDGKVVLKATPKK
jgi:hypothetical protein